MDFTDGFSAFGAHDLRAPAPRVGSRKGAKTQTDEMNAEKMHGMGRISGMDELPEWPGFNGLPKVFLCAFAPLREAKSESVL